MALTKLRQKVEALEKSMLAIYELNGICQQAICHGNQVIDLDRCALGETIKQARHRW